MRLFDYVYYRIFKFYEGFNESGPWAFGIPAMAMSQYFILLILDRVLYLLNITNFYFFEGNKEYLIMTAIFTFNFIRYYWLIPYPILNERWHDENRKRKMLGGMFSLLYLFGSLIGMLYLTGFFNPGGR
jgi:hypothetical protein